VPTVGGAARRRPSGCRGGAARRSGTASTTSLLASYAPVRRSCAFGEPGLLGTGWTCGGSKAAFIGTAPENGLYAACGGDDGAAGVPVPA
jgi:hypothetical protein